MEFVFVAWQHVVRLWPQEQQLLAEQELEEEARLGMEEHYTSLQAVEALDGRR